MTILFGKSLGIADSRSLCLTTELKHFKDFGLGDPMRSKLRILDIMIFLVILEWIWWMLDAVSARQRCRISWAAVELWHRRFYMNWQATAVERLGRDSKTACRSNSFQKHVFFCCYLIDWWMYLSNLSITLSTDPSICSILQYLDVCGLYNLYKSKYV